MDRDTLVRKFAQSVGVEKADAIIADAESELDLGDRTSYDRQEVQDLCEVIQYSTDGYLSQVANEIRVHEQAEQRFGALLGNVPDPAVIVTFEESTPIVRSVNDAFAETFGYSQAEADESPLTDLILPADLDATDAESNWLATTDRPGREVRRVTADGEARTFLFRSVMATREAGQVEGYGIYTEITERKRREQKLRSQNERLEQFVDMVSHDLRNPLTVANGRLELLLDDVEDESLREDLTAIQTSHERMESLIDDLLQLARQGQLADETRSVDLAAVSRSAWKQVDTGGAELTVDVDGYSIQAAPLRVTELLENLFRNAVEHGSTNPPSTSSREDAVEHGSTSPRSSSTREDTDELCSSNPGSQARQDTAEQSSASHQQADDAVERGSTDPPDPTPEADESAQDDPLVVRVGTLTDEDRSGFFVADNGPGIDRANADAVFERGYTTSEDGTGLGLSIVATIAGAHGWEGDVTESRSGGARFEFAW